MKRDFSSKLLDLKCKPVRPAASMERMAQALASLPHDVLIQVQAALDAAGLEELTYASAAADALTQPLSGDDGLSMGAKLKHMRLALRLMDGGEIEVTPEERELLKERVNRRYPGALVPARMYDFLEAEPAKLAAVEG